MKKTIVREYRLQFPYIKEKQELTLAFLTDLHDQVTGEDGERIFQLLEKQHPDLVLVGGDVVVGKKGCETEKAFDFLKNCRKHIRYIMQAATMNNGLSNIRRFTERSGKDMRQQ